MVEAARTRQVARRARRLGVSAAELRLLAETELGRVVARRPDDVAARRILALIHAARGDNEALAVELLLLAHLQHRSVTVAPGEPVQAGRVLGSVGNSGNTSEPHLHIHGVEGRVSDIDAAIRSAEPVAIRFAQRVLVRNDIFESDLLP